MADRFDALYGETSSICAEFIKLYSFEMGELQGSNFIVKCEDKKEAREDLFQESAKQYYTLRDKIRSDEITPEELKANLASLSKTHEKLCALSSWRK